MSYSIYDNTMNTVTVTGPTPSPVYTTNNTGGTDSGLYWGMNGTSAVPGQVLTSNGTNPSWIDADFEGEVTIKGKNIVEMFAQIEERLAILRPNEELEEKWENLRGLRKAYMELEQEIIEKEKVWKILKD